MMDLNDISIQCVAIYPEGNKYVVLLKNAHDKLMVALEDESEA